MELLTPGIGLVFWMGLSFGLVLVILRKYAWIPILSAIRARERTIVRSLVTAKRMDEELAKADLKKEEKLAEAERLYLEMLEKAGVEADAILERARQEAENKAAQILGEAQQVVDAQKRTAMMEIKDQIAMLSVDMAEKVLRHEFDDKGRNRRYVGRLLDEMILN